MMAAQPLHANQLSSEVILKFSRSISPDATQMEGESTWLSTGIAEPEQLTILTTVPCCKACCMEPLVGGPHIEVIGVFWKRFVTCSAGGVATNRRESRQHIDFIPEIFGGCDRDRTCDPLIKSQLLYQLSYAPTAALQRPARYRRWPCPCPPPANRHSRPRAKSPRR
jgi:hypothetical protein